MGLQRTERCGEVVFFLQSQGVMLTCRGNEAVCGEGRELSAVQWVVVIWVGEVHLGGSWGSGESRGMVCVQSAMGGEVKIRQMN